MIGDIGDLEDEGVLETDAKVRLVGFSTVENIQKVPVGRTVLQK